MHPDRRLAAVHGAAEIDVEDPVELLVAHVGDQHLVDDAGDVAPDVEPPVLGRHSAASSKTAALSPTSISTPVRPSGVSDRLGSVLRARSAPVRANDRRSRCGQQLR